MRPSNRLGSCFTVLSVQWTKPPAFDLPAVTKHMRARLYVPSSEGFLTSGDLHRWLCELKIGTPVTPVLRTFTPILFTCFFVFKLRAEIRSKCRSVRSKTRFAALQLSLCGLDCRPIPQLCVRSHQNAMAVGIYYTDGNDALSMHW